MEQRDEIGSRSLEQGNNDVTEPGQTQKPIFKLSPTWALIISQLSMIVLATLVATGKLTPQQAETVKTIVPLVVGDQQTPTPIQPEAPAAVSPEQIKQGIELAKLIFDALPRPTPQPVPVPVPIPDVTPVPNVDPPKPAPGPQPTALRITITDELDKPVTGNTIEPGRLIQVSASGATGKVGWQVSRHGPVSLIAMHGGGYTCSLQPGGWVEFFATDFGAGQQASARIAANQAPQPPPDPIPVPDVEPIPQPDNATGDRRAMILFDSASTTMTDDQRRVLGSMKLRDLLDARCVKQSDGTTGWRKFSVEMDVSRDIAPWPELFAQVKGQVQSVPSIALIRGKTIAIKPITDEASTIAVVEGWK